MVAHTVKNYLVFVVKSRYFVFELKKAFKNFSSFLMNPLQLLQLSFFSEQK